MAIRIKPKVAKLTKNYNYSIRLFNNLVFFDVPKAASTAIKMSLVGGHSPWGSGLPWDDSYHKYYTFAFVRHPFDRVLSTFSMSK